MKTYNVKLTASEISDLSFFLLQAKWSDELEEYPELVEACDTLWNKFLTLEEEIINNRLEVVD